MPNMSQRTTVLSLVLILLLLASVGGCKKQDAMLAPEARPEPAEPTTPPPPAPPPTREVESDFPTEPTAEPELTRSDLVDQWNDQGVLSTVYFAFDSSDLGEATRRTLQRNAAWLQAHPDVGVVVEGHCDERGTIEYNLALGERRADAVRDYLINLGLDRDRMRIITYGEERPVDPGHSEAAWSRNRRAAFVLEP
jgi:peptidoglycan-associated lipoprotein